MELSAIWALLAAFDSPLPIPSGLLESGVPAGTTLEGAFVEGIPAVTWMANNTAKLAGQVAESDSSSLECWTVFSSKEFGRSNKVPQVGISSLHFFFGIYGSFHTHQFSLRINTVF